MDTLSRRRMLTKSILGAGAVASAPLWTRQAAAAAAQKAAPIGIAASDRVELGRTGIIASRLAMGTGMHGSKRSSDHTRMGLKKFTALMNRGVDYGLNFFDMADLYGTHPFVRQALATIPREKYVLLSKIWARPDEWAGHSGGALKEVDRFRKELNTDVLDICLIHCMNQPDWPERLKRVRDEMSELKQKKVIRAVGVSCHGHEALKVAAELPWVDVIMARINHKGVKMQGSPEEVSKVLLRARANGKAVIGMKIFGEGQLVQPDQKDASFKYVLGNNLVDSMTIGMLKPEEVDDSVQRLGHALRTISQANCP